MDLYIHLCLGWLGMCVRKKKRKRGKKTEKGKMGESDSTVPRVPHSTCQAISIPNTESLFLKGKIPLHLFWLVLI
jgi:hypothetical protein